MKEIIKLIFERDNWVYLIWFIIWGLMTYLGLFVF